VRPELPKFEGLAEPHEKREGAPPICGRNAERANLEQRKTLATSYDEK